MLSLDILQMIYFAFVHSHLVYGIEIYANTHMKCINTCKLVVLNNKILRILQNVSRDTHTAELYAKFNTLPIPALHQCQILKLVHIFTHHHDKLTAMYSNYFAKNYMFHSDNTRINDSLHVDLFASTMGQRSIKYKGSTIWNSLHEEIKSITSTVS